MTERNRASADALSLDRLRRYAESRGLEITASRGDQREPENVVSIIAPGRSGALISRTSLDSIETAAFYLVNGLELLGVEVPR